MGDLNTQQLLCVKTEDYCKAVGSDGTSMTLVRDVEILDSIEDIYVVPRFLAEDMPEYLQLSAYCVLRHGDAVMAYNRIDGDKRLVGCSSIGIGGHVEYSDCSTQFDTRAMSPLHLTGVFRAFPSVLSVVRNALRRELQEELYVQTRNPEDWHDSAVPVALLHDASNAVGAVHLGVIFLLDLPCKEGGESAYDVVHPRSEEIWQPAWVSEEVLKHIRPDLESWSRILVDTGIATALIEPEQLIKEESKNGTDV